MGRSRPHPCEFLAYIQSFLPCDPVPVYGFEPVQSPLDRVYYYHSDHLNSSTYVTDDNGRPVAYYDYLPFGEVAVEHNQTTNFNNGYKFNAKELDEATGMSYYGARYYDLRISVFVSVDPLAEKYRNIGGYVYTANNPINFIDPDGREWKNNKEKERLLSDVNSMIKSLNKRIGKSRNKIESGKLNEQQIINEQNLINDYTERIKDLNKSIEDIERLDSDRKNKYALQYSSREEASVSVTQSHGIVYIGGSNTAEYFHEILHVVQSLNQSEGLYFDTETGKLLNSGRTNDEIVDNEVKAYQRQYAYGGAHSVGMDVKSINEITAEKIYQSKKKMKDGKLVPAYPWGAYLERLKNRKDRQKKN